MSWILRDYVCPTCSTEWEDLVDKDAQDDQECPSCGTKASRMLSAPAIATYSLMDKETQAKHLRKRSREHTMKKLKQDPTSINMTKRFKMKGK